MNDGDRMGCLGVVDGRGGCIKVVRLPLMAGVSATGGHRAGVLGCLVGAANTATGGLAAVSPGQEVEAWGGGLGPTGIKSVPFFMRLPWCEQYRPDVEHCYPWPQQPCCARTCC